MQGTYKLRFILNHTIKISQKHICTCNKIMIFSYNDRILLSWFGYILYFYVFFKKYKYTQQNLEPNLCYL